MNKHPLLLLCTALALAGCWDLASIPPTGGPPTATPRVVPAVLSPTPSFTPVATAAPVESPTPGTAALVPTFPAASTSVQFVLFRLDTPIYSGPGAGYNRVSQAYKNQTAAVTGVSFDDKWWRIDCPLGVLGSCWVSSDTKVTQATNKPKSSPGPTLPPTTTGTPGPSPLPASAGTPSPSLLPTPGSGTQYIQARRNVNIRRGPGMSYPVLGQLSAGQVVAVLTVSSDNKWWRIDCPGGGSTDCWVSADVQYTQPVTPPPGGMPTATPNSTRTPAPTATPHPTGTPAPTMTPTQTAKATPSPTPGGQYIRALRDVNIREGPGTTYKSVGILIAGTTVPTSGRSSDGGWWQIACPGGSGACYVSAAPGLTQVTEQP